MSEKTFVIINPDCHQGKAWKKWKQIRRQVMAELGPATEEYVLRRDGDLTLYLHGVLRAGQQNVVISAGGDGSLHHIVKALLFDFPERLKDIYVGAIGLGSSNDFHKPNKRTIQGVPVRLDKVGNAMNHDLGLVEGHDPSGAPFKDCFIVNASMGATANGNFHFNNPGMVLGWLKKVSMPLAINYTALATIMSHRNQVCRLKFGQEDLSLNLCNLNLLKIPYVSGSLRYAQQILPDDGNFMLNICHDMSKGELIRVMGGLESGRFAEGAHSMTSRVKELRVEADAPMVLACDGESMLIHDAHITLLPRAIKTLW